ncbi:MAG: GNAT family N-acetyltransferase [Phycisphaeraceae bacterium]|nr:GNAT family N-acetyltransferase [Phycisphaeraceae bacterium]MCW5755400.1 GNAT family N-acetyltransferase [Phycisphaeraceae bacterium]
MGSLCTSRLVLRPLRESDRSEFLLALAGARGLLTEWMPLHEPGEDDEGLFARQVRLTIEGERTGSACRRAGFRGDGRMVGCFNLTHIARGLHFEGDMNWWVSAEFGGRGLATEGVQGLLDYAFADLPVGLGLHRVTAGIQAGNLASRRLAERVGFRRREGVRMSLVSGGAWAEHEVWVAEPQIDIG